MIEPSSQVIGPWGHDPKIYGVVYWTPKRVTLLVVAILATAALIAIGGLSLDRQIHLAKGVAIAMIAVPGFLGLIVIYRKRPIDTSYFHERFSGKDAVARFITGTLNQNGIQKAMNDITEREVIELVQAMDNHRVNYQDERLPFLALKALELEYIDDHQAGTLIHFHSAFALHEKANYDKIYVEDFIGKPQNTITPQRFSLNDDSIEILEETLGLFNRESFKFTNEEKRRFLLLVKKLPKSEQQFLLIKNAPLPFLLGQKKTGSHAAQDVQFNILSGMRDKGDYYRVIPSVGIMQMLLYAKFGSRATNIIPISTSVGPVAIAAAWKHQGHVLCIPSFHIIPPKTTVYADGYYLPFYDFVTHDFYHCFVGSLVPEKHKKIYVAIWEKLPPKGKPPNNRFRFIDMDHSLYFNDQGSRMSENEKLCHTILEILTVICPIGERNDRLDMVNDLLKEHAPELVDVFEAQRQPLLIKK